MPRASTMDCTVSEDPKGYRMSFTLWLLKEGEDDDDDDAAATGFLKSSGASSWYQHMPRSTNMPWKTARTKTTSTEPKPDGAVTILTKQAIMEYNMAEINNNTSPYVLLDDDSDDDDNIIESRQQMIENTST